MIPDRVTASLITLALLCTAGCVTSPSPSSSSLLMDWVGENPMTVQAFTYTIELVESSLPSGLNIRLVSATRDR